MRIQAIATLAGVLSLLLVPDQVQRAVSIDEVFHRVAGAADKFDLGGGFVLVGHSRDGELAEYEVSFGGSDTGVKRSDGMASLSLLQFEDLLRRIDRVRPIGALVKPAGLQIVALGRKIRVDEHEFAMVERQEQDGRVVTFRAVYFRPVQGRLRAVVMAPDCRAQIDEHWYWISDQDAIRIRGAAVGTSITIRAAGPVVRVSDGARLN